MGYYAPNYPNVLDLTYPISQRNGTDLVLNNIEIGSICLSGDNLLVTWYDHNTRTFGVDNIDWDNKLDKAYVETKLIPVYRRPFANYATYTVDYVALPASTSIELYYSTDYGQTFILLTSVDDTDRKIITADLTIEATTLMLKFVARTNADDAPSFTSSSIQLA